ERAARDVARAVDDAGEELLAGPALALEERGDRGVGDPGHDLEDALPGRALAEDGLEGDQLAGDVVDRRAAPGRDPRLGPRRRGRRQAGGGVSRVAIAPLTASPGGGAGSRSSRAIVATRASPIPAAGTRPPSRRTEPVTGGTSPARRIRARCPGRSVAARPAA